MSPCCNLSIIEEEVNGLVIWLLDKAPFERKSQCMCSTECLINPPSNDFSVIGIVNLLRRQKESVALTGLDQIPELEIFAYVY